MWYLLLFAGIVALFLLGHLAAVFVASRIRSNPDTYSVDVLSREPEGETVFINRPDGTSLRAVVAGQGPIVVLAHGFSMTLQEWNVVFTLLLNAGYRVIAFDQRGHGKSVAGSDGIGSRQMAGDYQAILEHFDVRDGVLVGHSMGGFLSLVFMLTAPEVSAKRLKGVVLFATTAGNILKGSMQNQLQIPLINMGLLRAITRSHTYGVLFGASLYGKRPSPAGIRVSLDLLGAQNHLALMPILKALFNEDYYPRLGEIRIPCVVMCGTCDKSTPAWHSQRMATEIPGARAIWVQDKGHLLNWEAPEVLVDAVRSLHGTAKTT